MFASQISEWSTANPTLSFGGVIILMIIVISLLMKA
jgi:hypothetical protein